MNKKYINAILAATIYGSMPLLTYCLNVFGSNPVSNTFYRVFFAIPICAYICFFIFKNSIKITSAELIFLIFASFTFTFTVISLYSSYSYINSSLATTLHFTYPIIIFIFNIIITEKKVSKIEILGIIVFIASLFLFVLDSINLNLKGLILAFVSAIFYSFYSLILERKPLANMPNIKILFYINVFSSVILIFYTQIVSRTIYADFNIWQWIYAIFFSFVLTFATFLYQRSVLSIGASKTSFLATIEPITSIVIGFIFFKEDISLNQILATILILVTILIFTSDKSDNIL